MLGGTRDVIGLVCVEFGFTGKMWRLVPHLLGLAHILHRQFLVGPIDLYLCRGSNASGLLGFRVPWGLRLTR